MTDISGHSFHRPASWFESLRRYVQETDVTCLNLCSMNLKFEEAKTILEFLADSQVSELDLSDNHFRNQMESLSRLLTKTKIKKLTVWSYDLEHDDILGLMKNSKETQITNLALSKGNFNFHIDYDLFISHLLGSHLTALTLSDCLYFCHDEEALCFISALSETSLTHLNLGSAFCPSQHAAFLALFFNLKHTSITHLSLSGCCAGYSDLSRLGDSIRDSKLVELSLVGNVIRDNKVNSLFRALIGSKVTILDLDSNSIRGNNDLGQFLKETQITHLNLSHNDIETATMFSFPDFLKGSSVESLKLFGCKLTDEIGMPLMRSLRHSKVTHLDVGGNHFSEETAVVLSEVVNCTSLTQFDLSYSAGNITGAFVEKIIDSPITSLSLESHFHGTCGDNGCYVKTVAPSLENSQFTHVNLRGKHIGGCISSLAASLKFTSITHLNLAANCIGDGGADVLAKSLKETHIIDLDLSRNEITSCGAISLALFIKDAHVFNLKLNENKIGNIGLNALAEHARTSLITNLEVSKNPGQSSIVETVVWKNRRLVRQLVSFFKGIAPIDYVLQDPASTNIIKIFLEKCLQFYKLYVEQPSAASALAHEESVTLSSNEITSLLCDEFPKQFTFFIASKVEADVSDHVQLLKRAEELELHTIVEHLLLNRPVFTIDESHGILHPYIYELLIKYDLPICNLNIEPQGIERIGEYFTKFSDIEGAADVIRILSAISLS